MNMRRDGRGPTCQCLRCGKRCPGKSYQGRIIMIEHIAINNGLCRECAP